jgi:hypothetical protein
MMRKLENAHLFLCSINLEFKKKKKKKKKKRQGSGGAPL